MATYEDIKDIQFYAEEITDGFKVYDAPNGDLIAFIYSEADERENDQKVVDSCVTIEDLERSFDSIQYYLDQYYLD